MNDPWLDWAMRLQALAQAGLAYTKNPFDRERFEQIRGISAEIAAARSGLPEQAVRDVFCSENGYPTPKVDTRAAIFHEEKLLLVRESDGRWALPGGWCDVDQSVASNTRKEALEETGLEVQTERLIAVQDWRKHNVCNFAYGVVKIFVLCRPLGGAFASNLETTEACYFSRETLPSALAEEKTTREQLMMCFDAARDEAGPVLFD